MTEHEDLDHDLESLERMLRSGDHRVAGNLLASFAMAFATRASREESALADAHDRRGARSREVLAKVRREHDRLRGLVAALAEAVDHHNAGWGLDALGTLRSVLVIHLAKETSLAELAAPAAVG